MKDFTYSKSGNYRWAVSNEDDPMDPRDWENLGTMICFHRKYKLGDRQTDYKESNYQSWDELKAAIELSSVLEGKGGVLIFPLGLYDHSGISMYIGTKIDRWDSGQVGFIFVTEEDMKNEGVTREEAQVILENEVKLYDHYLRGDFYKWDLEKKVKACSCGECENWEHVDSNGGFDSYEDALKNAEDSLGYYEEEKINAN